MNRINIITLGVENVSKSLEFYRDGLGFETPVNEENPAIVFFNNGGTKLALYPLSGLAEDVNVPDLKHRGSAFPGITLAYNTKTKEEEDEILDKIENLGGKVVKKLMIHSGEATEDTLPIWMVITGKLLMLIHGFLIRMICL